MFVPLLFYRFHMLTVFPLSGRCSYSTQGVWCCEIKPVVGDYYHGENKYYKLVHTCSATLQLQEYVIRILEILVLERFKQAFK